MTIFARHSLPVDGNDNALNIHPSDCFLHVDLGSIVEIYIHFSEERCMYISMYIHGERKMSSKGV
jgi:hypothetical protein